MARLTPITADTFLSFHQPQTVCVSVCLSLSHSICGSFLSFARRYSLVTCADCILSPLYFLIANHQRTFLIGTAYSEISLKINEICHGVACALNRYSSQSAVVIFRQVNRRTIWSNEASTSIVRCVNSGEVFTNETLLRSRVTDKRKEAFIRVNDLENDA